MPNSSEPLELPIGIQAFETIREDGFVYVDKTPDIFRLVTKGRFYFLSRPRRFGKSLLVSTLRCLFQGRKELFAGLWIDRKSNWKWEQHPVLVFDFNRIDHTTPEALGLGLAWRVEKMAEEYNIELSAPSLNEKFGELIIGLHQQSKQGIVVLVDEYDKPLIEHMGRGEEGLKIAKDNRDILRRFLGVLKSDDVAPALQFVLVTGVSKFSKVSIFSELNNLDDITMQGAYATLCGYTEEELQKNFKEHLNDFAKKLEWEPEKLLHRLREYYNGYRFSENELRVYNPFCVLKALREQQFKDFWFESGTPRFLVDLLKEQNYPLPNIDGMETEESDFSTYDLDNLNPSALLFQTGYVTIQGFNDGFYTLGYPNREVKIAFLKFIWKSFGSNSNGSTAVLFRDLYRTLQEHNIEEFFEIAKTLFAGIPYVLQAQRDEAHYHSLFYVMMMAAGADTKIEILTNRGRIDMVIEFADTIYLIEFKCNQSAELALQQIQDKGYPEKFQRQNKALHLLGINFSSKDRNISDWKLEIAP